MWKESDKKLVVRLGSSPTLVALLLLMHVGAWAGVLIVPMPWYTKAMLVIAAGFSLRGSLMAHGLRQGPSAVVELELKENDCAMRFKGTLEWIPASLVDAVVHPWIVALRFRLERRRWPMSVVILRGATEPETFRALRVRLNGRATPSKGAANDG